MLNKKITTELNLQLNRELLSSYDYLGMAAYCDNQDLPGAANWLKQQSAEEREHAEKIYQYLGDMDANVKITALPAPKQDFKDIKEVFEAVLAAELKITESLRNLANVAQEEQDQVTFGFLQWFLTEQIEEVASARGVLEDIEKLGASGVGLYMLDEKLGSRNEESGNLE